MLARPRPDFHTLNWLGRSRTVCLIWGGRFCIVLTARRLKHCGDALDRLMNLDKAESSLVLPEGVRQLLSIPAGRPQDSHSGRGSRNGSGGEQQQQRTAKICGSEPNEAAHVRQDGIVNYVTHRGGKEQPLCSRPKREAQTAAERVATTNVGWACPKTKSRQARQTVRQLGN